MAKNSVRYFTKDGIWWQKNSVKYFAEDGIWWQKILLNILLRMVFVHLSAKIKHGRRPFLKRETDTGRSAHDQQC